MAVIMSQLFTENMGALRIERTPKRIRAVRDGHTVVESTDALLVWEPKRIVPTYAVPERDIAAEVRPTEPAGVDAGRFERIPQWDPRVPFNVRLTPGYPVQIDGSDSGFTIDGFVAEDPELAGYVILDFHGFDTWFEENDPIISHPHSPFSRIDIRETSKTVQLQIEGVTLAESSSVRILFETGLPVRYYLPRDDVLVELAPSDTVTVCAYKGVATYFSPVVAGVPSRDLAWSYENPLIDGEQVRGYICFFDEKLDVIIDGVERPRPQTPWS